MKYESGRVEGRDGAEMGEKFALVIYGRPGANCPVCAQCTA